MFQYVTEFIGIFIITTVALVQGDAISIGIAATAAILMGNGISGAQYNPAVTITNVIYNRMTKEEGLSYVASQIAGAIAAFHFVKQVKSSKAFTS